MFELESKSPDEITVITKKTTVRAVLGKNSKTSKTFTNLTAGRTYYIRSRAFIRIKGTRYFGAYSKATKIKCR